MIYSSSLLTLLNTGHTSNLAAFSAPHLWIFKHLQTQPFHSPLKSSFCLPPLLSAPCLVAFLWVSCSISMSALFQGALEWTYFYTRGFMSAAEPKELFLLSLLLCSAALLMQSSVQVTFIVSRTQFWGTFNSATMEEFLVSNTISLLMYFYT